MPSFFYRNAQKTVCQSGNFNQLTGKGIIHLSNTSKEGSFCLTINVANSLLFGLTIQSNFFMGESWLYGAFKCRA